jgi:hypothetical protein
MSARSLLKLVFTSRRPAEYREPIESTERLCTIITHRASVAPPLWRLTILLLHTPHTPLSLPNLKRHTSILQIPIFEIIFPPLHSSIHPTIIQHRIQIVLVFRSNRAVSRVHAALLKSERFLDRDLQPASIRKESFSVPNISSRDPMKCCNAGCGSFDVGSPSEW